MEIEFQVGNLFNPGSDLAMLATFEDAPLPAEVAELLEPNHYSGRANQTLLLYLRGALTHRRPLLVSLGPSEKATPETIRRYRKNAQRQEHRCAQLRR